MQMLFAVFLAFAVFFHGPASAQLSSRTTVFNGASISYALRPVVRLPALVATQTPGVLLAFCEARRDDSDTSNKEVVVSRSTDSGATWSAATRLGEDLVSTARPTGNPSPVLDSKSGTVFVFYGSSSEGLSEKSLDNLPKLYLRSTTDGGVSWSNPVDRSSLIPADYRLMLPGPGHGIQLKNGAYAGRLLVPFWGYRVDPDDAKVLRNVTGVLYSDDSGANWSLGGTEPVADSILFEPNESQLVEQGNGNVLKISRSALPLSVAINQPLVRVKSVSTNGGASFGRMVASAQFTGPVVEGAVLRVNASTLAFTAPSKDAANYTKSALRADLVVRYSEDDGVTWKYSSALPTGAGEYTDLAMVNSTTLGVLAELQDGSGSNTTIRFFTQALPGADSSAVTDDSGNNGAVRWVRKAGSTAASATGKFDTAAQLNGSSYIHVPDASPSLLTSNNFTLNLWFKSGSTYSNAVETLLWAYGVGLESPYQLWLRLDPTRGLRFLSTQFPSQGEVVHNDADTSLLKDGKWHMVTVVRSGTTMKFYVDKTLRTTRTGFFVNDYATARATDFGLVFGARPTNGSGSNSTGYMEHFNGALDAVQVHHRALSDSEITGLYTNIPPGDLTALKLKML